MKREEFEAKIAKTKHGSPEEQAVYDELLASSRQFAFRNKARDRYGRLDKRLIGVVKGDKDE